MVKRFNGIGFCAVAAAIAGLLACLPAAGDEEEVDAPEPRRCINSRSIRRTDVINDDYIVFHVQGRRMYLNALPQSCNGLSRDRRFSFETHTRSLCARDKIRILKETFGGVQEGRSCSLGYFQEMTHAELVEFFEDRSAAPETKELDLAEVEDVVTE